MAIQQLPYPLQFKRQYAGALDADSVFTNFAQLQGYVTNPSRYPGQPVTCLEKDGSFFVMNSSATGWIEFKSAESTNIDETNIVHINGDETILGKKTFKNDIVFEPNIKNFSLLTSNLVVYENKFDIENNQEFLTLLIASMVAKDATIIDDNVTTVVSLESGLVEYPIIKLTGYDVNNIVFTNDFQIQSVKYNDDNSGNITISLLETEATTDLLLPNYFLSIDPLLSKLEFSQTITIPRFLGLVTPVDQTEATNKKYVDDGINSVMELINGLNFDNGLTKIDSHIGLGGDLTKNTVINSALSFSLSNIKTNGSIFDVDILSTGKILIVGGFTTVGGVSKQYIARLNSDGSLDTSYDLAPEGQILGITKLPDGKFLIFGSFFSLNYNNVFYDKSLIIRLNSDGSLDTSFSLFLNNGAITSCLLTSNNKILLGGTFTEYFANLTDYTNFENQITVGRILCLNIDGTLDQTSQFNIGTWFTAVTGTTKIYKETSNNKIPISLSRITKINGVTFPTGLHFFNLDGTRYNTFSTKSIGTIQKINDVYECTDGSFLIGGSFTTYGTNTDYTYLIKVDSLGEVDLNFMSKVDSTINKFVKVDSESLFVCGQFMEITYTHDPAIPEDVYFLSLPGMIQINEVGYIYGFYPEDHKKDLSFYHIGQNVQEITIKGIKYYLFCTNDSLMCYDMMGKIFEDFFTLKFGVLPVEYLEDFSSIFKPNSLITKKFVEDKQYVTEAPKAFGTYYIRHNGQWKQMIVENGLTYDEANKIKLGGVLNSNTEIGNTQTYLPFNGLSINDGSIGKFCISNDGGIFVFFQVANNYKGRVINKYSLLKFNKFGDIDESFFVNVTATIDSNASVQTMFQLPTGDLIIGGKILIDNKNNGYLTCVREDGSLNPNFPIFDQTLTIFVSEFSLSHFVDTNCFYVILNNSSTYGTKIKKFNFDGVEDVEFKSNIGTGFYHNVVNNGYAHSISKQSSGKLIISGFFNRLNGNIINNTIVRLNTNGTIDTTFVSGFLDYDTTRYFSKAFDNDKIAVWGYFTDNLYNNETLPLAVGATYNMIMLLNSDGTRDVSFTPINNVQLTGFSFIDIFKFSNGKYALTGLSNKLIFVNSDGIINSGISCTFSGGNVTKSKQISDDLIVYGAFTSVNSIAYKYITKISGITGQLVYDYYKFGVNHKPLEYSKNLSSSFVGRSLVDKEFVLSQLPNILGIYSSVDDGKQVTIKRGKGIITTSSVTLFDTIMKSNITIDSPSIIIRKNFTGIFSKDFIVLDLSSVSSVENGLTLFDNIASLGGIVNNDIDFDCQAKFNPDIPSGGEVYVIKKLSTGKYLVGGTFTSFGSLSTKGLVRLNANGSIDNTFSIGTIGFTGVVSNILELSNGKYLICGAVTNFNGLSTNAVILNEDGSRYASFNPIFFSYNSILTTFEASDGSLLFGGFTVMIKVSMTGILLASVSLESSVNSIIETDRAYLLGHAYSYLYDNKNSYGLIEANKDTLKPLTTFTSGFNGTIYSLEHGQNNRIYVSGDFSSHKGVSNKGIVRLNSDYSLDTNYNLESGVGFDKNLQKVIRLQSDNKLVVVGDFNSFNGVSKKGIIRFNTDGTIDNNYMSGIEGSSGTNGFGISDNHLQLIDDLLIFSTRSIWFNNINFNGMVILDMIGKPYIGYNEFSINSLINYKTDISARYTDRSLVDFGYIKSRFVLPDLTNKFVRLNNNWVLADKPINGNGINVSDNYVNFGGILNNNTILRGSSEHIFGTGLTGLNSGTVLKTIKLHDGRILITGDISSYNNYFKTNTNKLLCLFSDGSVDTIFHKNIGIGANVSNINGIVQQIDGKILIFGNFTSFTTRNNVTTKPYLVRINVDGTLDTTFMENVAISFNGTINYLVLDNNDKIYCSGNFTSFNGTSINRLIRLNTDGTHDTNFVVGTGLTNLSILKYHSISDSIFCGNVSTYKGVSCKGLVKLLNNGNIDTNFNLEGTGFEASGGISDFVIDNDNKIVAVGMFTSFNGISANRLLRLNSNGSLDTVFLIAIGTGFNSEVKCVVIDNNYNIMIGGHFTLFNDISASKLIKLNPDGSISQNNYQISTSSPNLVVTITKYNNNLIIGGVFPGINGVLITNIAMLDVSGNIVMIDTKLKIGENPIEYLEDLSLKYDDRSIPDVEFVLKQKETRDTIIEKIGTNGIIDTEFLPSFVDDVIEVDNYSELPLAGESGKFYVTLNDITIEEVLYRAKSAYRWSGSVWQVIIDPDAEKNFVHKYGDESIDGIKTFLKSLSLNGNTITNLGLAEELTDGVSLQFLMNYITSRIKSVDFTNALTVTIQHDLGYWVSTGILINGVEQIAPISHSPDFKSVTVIFENPTSGTFYCK